MSAARPPEGAQLPLGGTAHSALGAPASLLSIQDLTVTIGDPRDRQFAVNGISFNIEPNEIVCVVGESGSGKSITAQAVMGLLDKGQLKATGGAVFFRGTDVLKLAPDEHRALRGKKIGMVFQEPMTALNPIMRVGAQVEEVLALHTDLTPAARKARVVSLFESVLLPNPALICAAYPFELSGGQRQRVVIAIALAVEPDLLIADEPTTALDVTTQAQIIRLIRDIQRRLKIGVLFITHDIGIVAEIADSVVVMRQGRVVEHGPARQILNMPRTDYTRALIAAVPHTPEDKPVATQQQPLVELARVSLTFHSNARQVHALRDVTLTVHAGETLGLVGESGSGKSTLGRAIVGLNHPDDGSIRFEGAELLGITAREFRSFRRHIQMVFQDPYASLNPRHRVLDAIAQGPIAFGVRPKVAREEARELLSLVGLSPDAGGRFPHQFSGGQRQRIGIARALALKPRLLIADEAVSALDVSIQAQVLRLLADISRRLNLAVLFITHDLRVAAQICDRIAVMQQGRIVEFSHASEIFFRPQHEYTRRLIESIPGKSWVKPATMDAALPQPLVQPSVSGNTC